MEAEVNFWKSLKYYSSLGKLLGMQSFLKKDFKYINRISLITIGVIIMFYFQFAYTLYVIDGTFILIMQAMFPLGIGLQVCAIKLIFVFENIYFFLIFKCSGIVFDQYLKSSTNYELCQLCLEMHVKYYKEIEYRPMINQCCERIIFWSRISIFFKISSITFLPIVVHLTTTHREILLVLYLPGIDSSGYPGYEITTAFHIIYFVFTGIGLCFYEITVFAISLNTTCMGNILISKMKKADQSKEKLGKELQELIKLYVKEYVDLIKTFSKSYSFLITVKFVTAIMNISFALFVIQLVSLIVHKKIRHLNVFLERLECWLPHRFCSGLRIILVWRHWNANNA